MPIFLHGCQAVSERKTKVQMRQLTWIRLGVKLAGAASWAFKRQTARFCFLFFLCEIKLHHYNSDTAGAMCDSGMQRVNCNCCILYSHLTKNNTVY